MCYDFKSESMFIGVTFDAVLISRTQFKCEIYRFTRVRYTLKNCRVYILLLSPHYKIYAVRVTFEYNTPKPGFESHEYWFNAYHLTVTVDAF